VRYGKKFGRSKLKRLFCNHRLDRRRTSCAGGLELKFRDGQILHSFANGSPPLQHLRK